MTGAKYFADRLKANNGSFLKTLGEYNGWEEGMTAVSIFFVISCTSVILRITPSGLRYSHALDLLPRAEQP